MRAIWVCAALILLAACSDSHNTTHPAAVQATSPTMPPMRIGNCANSVLVDEKCTQDWYSCADGRSVCMRHWEECCHSTSMGH